MPPGTRSRGARASICTTACTKASVAVHPYSIHAAHEKNTTTETLPHDGIEANVAGMIYIAVGLAVALVGADLFELTKRRTTYRDTSKL